MSSKLKQADDLQQRISFFIPSFFVLIFTIIGIMNSFNSNNLKKFETVGEETLASTHQKQKWMPNPIEKHLTIMRVALESANDIPKTADEAPLLIKGSVVLNHAAATSASYKWILPEGVTLVSGNVSGPLNPSRFGQEQSVEITVFGFDQTEKKIITLVSEAAISDQVYGASAVLSSRPQDSMEYIAPEMKAAADLFVEGL